MKSSEKMIVGICLAVAGVALIFYAGLPQWDVYNTNTTKAASLNDELKSSQAQKIELDASIARLKHNIALPLDIDVQAFTSDTESTATKALLDHVVGLATQANNKFISLSPAEVPPLFTPPSDDKSDTANSDSASNKQNDSTSKDNQVTKNANGDTTKSDDSALLVTKGYELTIRGTYDSLQYFLRAMDAEKKVFDLYNF